MEPSYKLHDFGELCVERAGRRPLALARLWPNYCRMCGDRPGSCLIAGRSAGGWEGHRLAGSLALHLRDCLVEDFAGTAEWLTSFLSEGVRLSRSRSQFGGVYRHVKPGDGRSGLGIEVSPAAVRDMVGDPNGHMLWERIRYLTLCFAHELAHLAFFPECWARVDGAEGYRRLLAAMPFQCERAIEGVALEVVSQRLDEATAYLRAALGEEEWRRAIRVLEGREPS